MPEYDPEVTTHIIAEAHSGPTLRALNLRSLKQIPKHIPTVKWPWVLTAMDVQSCSQDEIDRKLGDYSRYAAFVERIHAGCELSVAKSVPTFRSKGKERALGERPGEGSISRDMYVPVLLSVNSTTPADLRKCQRTHCPNWPTCALRK
jgi:DNA polymerase lambda